MLMTIPNTDTKIRRSRMFTLRSASCWCSRIVQQTDRGRRVVEVDRCIKLADLPGIRARQPPYPNSDQTSREFARIFPGGFTTSLTLKTEFQRIPVHRQIPWFTDRRVAEYEMPR